MRIRSIKPEFFDSPSTATCTPWARLLFIAMWCMADDWGVGSANPKEMAANAFPNDDQWTPQELPRLCKEVTEAFGVIFYTHRGRRYFQIPSWDDHQITQRRAKRRYPTSDDPESVLDQGVPESHSVSKEVPCNGKENASREQGNKEQGNKEQGNSEAAPQPRSAPADPPREDVERICTLFADLCQSTATNGKRPTITKAWRDAARRLIDLDGRTVDDIERITRWALADDFWVSNVRSLPKLREKFETLTQQAQRPTRQQHVRPNRDITSAQSLVASHQRIFGGEA